MSVPATAGITKPFHYPELLARIGAVLMRMARARSGHELRYGDLLVNTLSREVTVAGMRVDLSAKEYSLLATLAATHSSPPWSSWPPGSPMRSRRGSPSW